jgi:tRNA acetyltransferase TAN1
MVHDYNLLVSHERRYLHASRGEILRLLGEFGDTHPVARRTIARGLMGVRTALRNTGVIRSVFTKFSQDAMSIRFTLKWTPIDLWCDATLESMKQSLAILQSEIKPRERWMMHVQKRRFTIYHRIDIIKELAELIDEKVDLRNPDKIVWIEIIGKQAGMKVLRPDEIFSLPKLRGY